MSYKRSLFKTYMDTAMNNPTETDGKMTALADGVTFNLVRFTDSLSENNSAQTESTKYIVDDNATTDVTGYESSIEFEYTLSDNDEVSKVLNEIRREKKIGSDCITTVVNVDFYEVASGKAGEYVATLHKVAVQVGNYGGDSSSKIKQSATLSYQGDPVVGTFNPTTKKFSFPTV